MAKQYIKIRGANEHNLKNISVDIPRNELVVLTGLSGSGKSSLAFDTIYAEGQRRYMESLSSYARQFLGQMEKPDVESIEGLSPAISIDQKSTNRNPRSTVGTVTEIYDYMRLLYARVGIPHCPKCGKEIRKQTIDQMVDQIMAMPERTRIQLLAPVVRGRKGEHAKVLEQARRSGYVRVRIDGNLYELSEEIKLEKNIKHNIEVVVDRLAVREGIEKRLTDSIETVMALSGGLMTVDVIGGEPVNFSQSFSCPDCGVSIDEVEPRSFSFNNPFGACPECFGLGYKMEFDLDLMIPDKSLSINQGAIVVLGWQSCTDKGSFTRAILDALCEEYHFDLDTPFEDYPQEIKDILLYGTKGHEVKVHYKSQRGEGVYDVAFEGLLENVNRRYKETFSEASKAEYETYMRITPCPVCKGQRLKKESLAVTVGGLNIFQATNMSILKFKEFMDDLELSPSLLNFFEATSPLLDQDETIACISAFNDNAMADKGDPKLLRRSSYFPNLALMFSLRSYNKIWKDQVLTRSTNGWDHWLRIRSASLHMEGVFPVVPRVRHGCSENSTTAKGMVCRKLRVYPLFGEKSMDLGNLNYILGENYDRFLLSQFFDPEKIEQAIQLFSLSEEILLQPNRTIPDFNPSYLSNVNVQVFKHSAVMSILKSSNTVNVLLIVREVAFRSCSYV